MTYAKISFLGLLAAFAASGCGGEDGPGISDEQDLTETGLTAVRFEVTGSVRGEPAGTSSGAEKSWKNACDRWAATMREVSGQGRVESVDCSKPTSLASGSVEQRGSLATARVTAQLPKGSEPVKFASGPVFGLGVNDEWSATLAWVEACEHELLRMKAVYGKALLGGSCGEPSAWASGSTVGYKSTPTLWIAPIQGTPIAIEGYAFGVGDTQSVAQTAWRARCDAWVERGAALSGSQRLGTHDCGTPVAVSSGSRWMIESKPTAFVVPRLVKGSKPEVVEIEALAVTSQTQAAGLSDALAACDAAIDLKRTELGKRFLAGSCAQPTLLQSGSSYKYEPVGKVWLGDIDESEPEPPPPDSDAGAKPPVGPDPALTQKATSCEPRCVAMAKACNVGPEEELCSYLCEDANEGQLQCAEKTSCADYDDWFNVCGLG